MKLIMKIPDMDRRVWEFFNSLKNDPKLQKEFVRNPVGTLVKAGIAPSTIQISIANRMLFSLISNEGFMKWASTYQHNLSSRLGGKILPSKLRLDEIYHDIIDAMLQFMDRELLVSLVGELDTSTVTRGTRHVHHGGELPSGEPVVVIVNVIAAVTVALLVFAVTQIDATPAVPERMIRMDTETLAWLADFLESELRKSAKERRNRGDLSNARKPIK